MIDDEILSASKFSLFPLSLDTLPSENVLRSAKEPFWLKGERQLSVWFDDDDNFALSGTKECKTQGVQYELFETYEELAKAVEEDRA